LMLIIFFCYLLIPLFYSFHFLFYFLYSTNDYFMIVRNLF